MVSMGILTNKIKYKNVLKSNFKHCLENKGHCWEMKIPKNILARVMLSNLLTEEERDLCEGQITCSEARAEMLNMARNKTPGNDGLTIEFYEKCWPLISKQLVDSFNFAYENNLMSVSQRQGTIKLIPKPNKDKLLLNNWRPITLLNVDVKILSKSLAKRAAMVIGKLVDSQQTAFVKGRYIGEGIRLISDLMHYAEEEDLMGIILALDLTKAFDSLSHMFILNCLEAFNFGPSFIHVG